METSLNHQENHNPSHNGLPHPIGSVPNTLYPITFVQANTSSFKQIVQMLTGSCETAKLAAVKTTRPVPNRNPVPPIRPSGSRKQKASKLYERRNNLKDFKISTLISGLGNYSVSPPKPETLEILSPAMLKFPGLVLSPVTPLLPDLFNRSLHDNNGDPSVIDMEAENKAIAHKGFYLHPSPSSGSEPRLLPLFPVTSPRLSGSS